MKEMPYSAWPGGFYSQPLIQNTKKPKENTIRMGKIRKKAKKMTNISQKVNINMNSAHEGNFALVRNFAQREISSTQVQNFRTLVQNFRILAFSALLSFLFLICNHEFYSNSMCLDPLNKFDINSLQKL